MKIEKLVFRWGKNVVAIIYLDFSDFGWEWCVWVFTLVMWFHVMGTHHQILWYFADFTHSGVRCMSFCVVRFGQFASIECQLTWSQWANGFVWKLPSVRFVVSECTQCNQIAHCFCIIWWILHAKRSNTNENKSKKLNKSRFSLVFSLDIYHCDLLPFYQNNDISKRLKNRTAIQWRRNNINTCSLVCCVWYEWRVHGK